MTAYAGDAGELDYHRPVAAKAAAGRMFQPDLPAAIFATDMTTVDLKNRSDAPASGGAPGAAASAGAHEATLSCRHVWKLFGHDADAFLARHPDPDDEQLAGAGLIRAVRDVSIDVHRNEIFVIMGLSGSGKSTLVRCMSRLIEPSHGEIIFQGQDLLRKTERELIEIRRHKMGMVFQHFALLPHLTVLDNVAFPADGAGREPRYA